MNDSLYYIIAFLIGGIVATYIGVTGHFEVKSLQEKGLVVQSMPLEKYNEITTNGSVSGYEISPKFTTPNGKSYTCTGEIGKYKLDKIQSERRVEVRYLPKSPNKCEIVGGERENYVILIILGIISLLGSFFSIYKRRSE